MQTLNTSAKKILNVIDPIGEIKFGGVYKAIQSLCIRKIRVSIHYVTNITYLL